MSEKSADIDAVARPLGHGTDATLISLDLAEADILTDVERDISLSNFLADRPQGDVWVFAYGSLILNPVSRNVEQRAARIEEWRRSFCFATMPGRGSPQRPGLVLGLD